MKDGGAGGGRSSSLLHVEVIAIVTAIISITTTTTISTTIAIATSITRHQQQHQRTHRRDHEQPPRHVQEIAARDRQTRSEEHVTEQPEDLAM